MDPDPTLEIRLLGPVEAWSASAQLDLGVRQQRLILAVLALEAGQVLPADRLMTLLWPISLPDSARTILHNRIHGLRKVLGERRLQTHGLGYRLEIDRRCVDAHRFRDLVREADAASSDALRLSMLAEADGLWRGPALTGITGDESVRRRLAGSLDEARLVAVEDRMDAALREGRDAGLLDELLALTEAHPDRERPARQFMLALSRSGQTTRALEWAHGFRLRWRDEYGIDPSTEFLALEQSIRTGDRRIASAHGVPHAPSSIPRMLPPGPTSYVGRTPELAVLDASARLVAITGLAGVGKTALALRWAHESDPECFPHGHLYVDLRGFAAGPPRTPREALIELLFNMGHELRPDIDEGRASALFRTATADRRLLVVLDNAVDAAQVRPLLPSGPGCRTIVTSRNLLPGLVARDGAVHLGLDVLSPGEAGDLLLRLVGTPSRPALPELTPGLLADLLDACGRLPLALRLAAAQIVEDPDRDLARYVADLRAEPLTVLEVEGDRNSAVAAAFDLSYQRLAPFEQRIFGLLGVIPGDDFDAAGAAAVAGIDPTAAARSLRRLTSAHLLEHRGPGRYGLHDLLRDYARSLIPDAETGVAFVRLLDRYARGAAASGDLLNPKRVRPVPPIPLGLPADRQGEFDTVEAAAHWSATEHRNIVAAITVAAITDPVVAQRVVALTYQHLRFTARRGPLADSHAIAESALVALQTASDPPMNAHLLLQLGEVQNNVDRMTALETVRTALKAAEQDDDVELRIACLAVLGAQYRLIGELANSQQYLERARDLLESLPGRSEDDLYDFHIGENLAALHELRGEYDRADELYTHAIEVFGKSRSRSGQSWSLTKLAGVRAALGDVEMAYGLLQQAIDVARIAGNRRAELFATTERAHLHIDAGRLEAGLADATRSLAVAKELPNTAEQARAQLALGRATVRLTGTGHPGEQDRLDRLDRDTEGFAHLETALILARSCHERRIEILALIELALATRRGRDEFARQAEGLAADGGFVVLESIARALA